MRNKEIIIRFYQFYKPYLAKLVKAGGLVLLGSGLQLPLPLITMYIIDNVLLKKDFHLLGLLCTALLLIGILRIVFGFIQDYYLQYIRLRVTSDIRNRLFAHVINFPMASYHKRQTGDLMSRVLNDISASQGLFADAVISLISSSLALLFGVVIIFTLNWRLALVSIISLPFFVFSILFFSEKIKSMSKKSQARFADVSRSLNESLQAPAVIKSFGREKKEKVKFFSTINRLVKQQIKTYFVGMTASGLTSLVGMAAPLVVLWYGGKEVMSGHLTLGGFVAFNSFLMYLFNPIQNLIGLNIGVQSALGAGERIFELLQEPTEKYQNGKHMPIFNRQITIKDLSFSYDGQTDCLKSLNFAVRRGEKIAIIGKSGSGKSTFANLLLRFYDLQEGNGQILVDGTDLRELSLKSIRDQIGIVHQETFLFTGSVYDNILYSRKNASPQEVYNAAKAANIHDFILQLPAGYHTNVGERGVRLSGGERQRIALARMILKKPSVIILDEAMSHLDFENERTILDNLFAVFPDKTFIIITHRPYLLKNIDRLVVLDNGRMISMGKMSDILPNFEDVIYNEMKEVFYEKDLPLESSQAIQ